ncbi:peptidoglycan-binding protein [Pseudalgibacter alginicilyticus]|uniref:Peptidoglycan-binding protein n=1 Tax=Pseudalgibacter alginicilyticus TaxID=1736674 RepID=A0A0P0D3B1_9FLAO|nr:LysM peptidoglycan-binding domain-containing protein [Pseudalgibacter alginicilyticus]ALJ04425.1 peptidoglycan-binding protein [Pseudalgibacter alginicilyticus]
MNRFFLVLILILVSSLTTVTAQNFSTHQVKSGETIDAIAKRYYITPSDIYDLNPDARKELKPNTVLIIPLTKAVKPEITIVKELQGYKTHKTSRKETLYSLAKTYNVTEDEIKKHNTFLYANPLRKGDKLQIPIFKVTEVVKEVKQTKTYTVLPKEGKWRVAYKFGITVKELEDLNPEMGAVLQEGQVLNVPNIEDEEEKVVDENYSYYKVLPKEGFYRLKLKIGVEQEVLESLNPGLKETGLKVGMILKIPFSQVASGIEEASKKIDLTNNIKNFETKHIAVMLPFRLHRVRYDSVSGIKNHINKDPYLNASLDFHSGVLVAIDSLKQLGVSLKVDVYDTKYEVGEVIKIMKENNFENVDAVIGPLTPNTFEKVASELRGLHTPVISPIGENLNLYDNVFQSKPSEKLFRDKIVNYIKADSLVNNIVIVSDSKNTDVANSLLKDFYQAKQVRSRKDKEGKEQNYILIDDIKGTLKPGKNVVFLETNSEGLASNVSSILKSLIQKENKETGKAKIEIVLVTTNFNSAFEGDQISNEHLSSLKFTYAAASKPYNSDAANSFIKKYVGIYKTTPNSRATKGFDLTMDVVLRLVTSDDIYMSVNEAALTQYVENKFAYKKKAFGGYYNEAVYLVKYEDLSIVEIEQ